jgi:hypothetical protein
MKIEEQNLSRQFRFEIAGSGFALLLSGFRDYNSLGSLRRFISPSKVFRCMVKLSP